VRLIGLALIVAFVGCASQGPSTAIPGQRAPDFTLVDQDGHPFTLSQQRGKAVVLFFGYTHCPDVCPTTLAHVQRAVASLGPTGQRIRVAFITVDPRRDTSAVLRSYVALFGKNVVGLRGSDASLASLESAYHVWAQRLPSKSAEGYLVAHSSAIYLIDPNGTLVTIMNWTDTPDELAAAFRKLLS